MRTVAIVILNWNGKHFLERFLPSLLISIDYIETFMPFIVIADNNSEDGSVEWLKEDYPDIEVITLDRNWGFTGGYNRALQSVKADYYILLNSDVEVNMSWLLPLFDFMEDNTNAGICMPKILSQADREYFEYAGASGGFIDILGYPFCRGRVLSHIEKDNGQYNNPIEVFWATGTALMIRSELYHMLGGLDESFFAHMEEIDLCWRAKLLGFQSWVIPKSIVYHVGGGTLPNNSPRKLYYNYRNNLLMLYRNLPAKYRKRILPIRTILDNLSAIVFLIQGRGSYFKAVRNARKDYKMMRKEIKLSATGKDLPYGIYKKPILLFRNPFKNGKLK